MKFEKDIFDKKWRMSLTSMSEIKNAVKDGLPITVGRVPVSLHNRYLKR